MANLKFALIALTTFASAILASSPVLLRSEDVLIRPYASISHLTQRDISSVQNTTDSNTSTSLATWDNTTNTACLSTLSALHQSSNPSGTCVCYNLPSLNSDTGVFEADLRLYKISEPRGAWAGVAPENVMVGLKYNGATVSSVKPSDMSKNSSSIVKRDGGPELLRTYMFVGQIDEAKMAKNMSMAYLEAVVMPILTLTAKNTTGSVLSTNVTTNEAAFLTGVFAQTVVMSDFSAAQAAVDAQLAGLKNGTVAFVLPGIQLMIFPVGLVITSVWLLVGLAVYGFGTYERLMYAEMYKRRQAVTMSRGKRF